MGIGHLYTPLHLQETIFLSKGSAKTGSTPCQEGGEGFLHKKVTEGVDLYLHPYFTPPFVSNSQRNNHYIW